MASDSTVIVEEFLRSGSPQIRKNALTALAVIDDEDSACLIAKTAVEDEDSGVRRRAEEESLSLSGAFLTSMVDVFLTSLSSPEFQKQQRAYAVLGRLKSTGIDLPHPRMAWGNRMRLAGSMNSYLYPVRSLSFRLRSWQPGLLGTLVGLIPFVAFIASMTKRSIGSVSVAALPPLLVLIVGMLTAVFATQFATPISLQLRPFAATLVELVAAFVPTLLSWVVLFVLLGWLGVFRFIYEEEVFRAIPVLIPFMAMMAAFVRLGTILPVGRLNLMKGQRKNTIIWLIQLGAGTLVGSLLATIPYVLLRLNAPLGADMILIKSSWLALIAIAFGLATAFAKIDAEAYQELD